jgi:hypothetical protein
VHYMVMIPMMYGDDLNVVSTVHSIDQTKVGNEENILLESRKRNILPKL